MQTTLTTFCDRKNEISLYFDAISEIYSIKEHYENENTTSIVSDDFIKILKSNALLMIYNLVESSVTSGLLEIYEELKNQNLSYLSVSSEIKDIWFSFKFHEVYDKSSHYNSYKSKAFEIINSIIDSSTISLNRKAFNISGNLDADKIRDICGAHGISFTPPNTCRGGIVLTDVKNKRNELAHGSVSFVECGRNYSLEDLNKIKDETIIFLDALLIDIKKYYDNQKFKS